MKTKNKLVLTIVFVGILISVHSLAQTVTGSGTAGKIPIWTITGSIIGNSQIQDNGTNVGIGAAGSYKLDVNGDINSAQGNAYRMAGNKILWYNSTATNNIFAGVGAGAAITSGTKNTFMGNSAGTATTNGYENSFFGYEAGKSNTTGRLNTAIGYQALYSAQSQYYSTAIGSSPFIPL